MEEVRNCSVSQVQILEGILHLHEFSNVHPLVKDLFPISVYKVKSVAAGRLRLFVKNWQIISQDPWVLQTVMGYQIPLISKPVQNQEPYPLVTKSDEMILVDQEVKELLKKGAIQEVSFCQNQFLSSIFLVKKKDTGFRPVVNLKPLNRHITYEYFKMEGLPMLKELLQPKD